MFSVGVQWTELERYLSREFNREIIRVPGDRACFIRSVKHCLSRDLDVKYTIDEICDKIFEEVCDNSEEYSKFHTNSKRQLISDMLKYLNCCDMGQNDTIGKIELNPSIVLSSDNTNCKNDIQLFHQLFDELSVYRDYH